MYEFIEMRKMWILLSIENENFEIFPFLVFIVSRASCVVEYFFYIWKKENEIKIDKKEKSRDFTKNRKAGVCVYSKDLLCVLEEA